MPAPANLVHQQTTDTGLGPFTVSVVNGKQSFASAFGIGGTDVFDVFISNQSATEWVRGTGHMASSSSLVVDTVKEGTNGLSAVNFSAGTKDVSNDIPALSQIWTGSGDLRRNRVINPMGQFLQAGLASTSDGNYTGFDQWYALTQTGAITPSQVTDPENGTPFMMRLTQAQATAQRFGLAQPFEKTPSRDLRGKTVSFRARLRCSASTTIRWALVEWTGTADSLTKDIVNDWTSSTFTTGNFFISTTTTVVGTGSVALTANTLTDAVSNALGAISSSMNNMVLFIWTDSTQAQNVTLDIGNVWLGESNVAVGVFEPRDPVPELMACQRYYCKTYDIGIAPGATSQFLNAIYGNPAATTSFAAMNTFTYPVVMRATPSIAYYSPQTGTSAKAYNVNAAADIAIVAAATGSRTADALINNVSVPAQQNLFTQAVADARL